MRDHARAAVFGTLAAVCLTGTADAQGRAPSRNLIDIPTAGTNEPGTFETRTKAFPGGGLEVRLDVGLAHWISVGGSYGGQQIIGDGDPDWNPEPGYSLKIRVLQEDWVLPAVAIGVDTQGSGFWDSDRDRYQYQSRGLYVVASKNYAWLGDLSVHGGVNRSFEGDDENLNPFVGAEKSLGAWAGLALEYDLGLNDNRDDGVYGRGTGYLNGAVSWNLSPEMQVRFVVRDMLKNAESVEPGRADRVLDEGWGREFTFAFTERF
ncbi:MAG TPA: YjbH domain-containing protein [bacterium]|nr:YjbH domain-containing protein [bacterium]